MWSKTRSRTACQWQQPQKAHKISQAPWHCCGWTGFSAFLGRSLPRNQVHHHFSVHAYVDAPCQNRLPFFLPARSFFRPIMPCRENISHPFENPWRWDMLRSLHYTAIPIFILVSFYLCIDIYIYLYLYVYIYIRSDPIILKSINLTKKSTCWLKKYV